MTVQEARDQRLEALATANTIRVGKADLKRQLGTTPRSSGTRHAAQLVRDDTGGRAAGALYVAELLRAISGFGAVKAAKICQHAGVPGTRRVRELTRRQRDALALALENERCL